MDSFPTRSMEQQEASGNDRIIGGTRTCTTPAKTHPFFTKHIDEDGKFYYIRTETGQITHDIPHGAAIPLQHPTLTEHEELEQKQQWDEWEAKKREKEQIRLRVIQDIRGNHEKKQRKIQEAEEQTQSNQRDGLWKRACDRGRLSGIVSLNDYGLGCISNRIYNFEKDYNRPLHSLTLHANELKWTSPTSMNIERLTTDCATLRKLSLASNRIQHLDSQIAQLKQLTHLNLVRNGLVSLPDAIGDLIQLQELDVSDNALTSLPRSIENLQRMKVLRLECNHLTQLPDVIGRMSGCREIHVNANQLSTLPGSIGNMKQLRMLLANDNGLRFLPVEVANCVTLQVLHLSRNNIRELPKSIERMTNLTSIWLDFNLISTLPYGFHKLVKLQELKLEGNKDLVHPTMDVVVKGAREVIKWCKLKLAYKERTREKNIVLDTLSLLEQVEKHWVDGGISEDGYHHQHHQAVFESNVMYKGDRYYQFLMPTFWDSFVPSMERIWSESKTEDLKGVTTSFLYEKREVEQVLTNYQDAGGKLFRYEPKALFRRCCCVVKKNGGRGKVCVPPRLGWMCRRPAVMVRMNLIMESAMVEKRRRQNELMRVEEAVKAGEKVATQYLDSEEGSEMVRSLAEKELLSHTDDNEGTNNAIDEGDKPKTKKLQSLTNIFRRQEVENEALVEAMNRIRGDFIKKEVATRRKNTIETNQKIKKVMDAWIGCTAEDIFHQWKEVVSRLKDEKKVLAKRKERERLRLKEEENERHRMAQQELSLWILQWDEFNDRAYWQHSYTGETLFDEPTIAFILGKGWNHLELKKRNLQNKTQDDIGIQKTDERNEAFKGRLEKEALKAAQNILRLKLDNANK